MHGGMDAWRHGGMDACDMNVLCWAVGWGELRRHSQSMTCDGGVSIGWMVMTWVAAAAGVQLCSWLAAATEAGR